MKKIIKELFKFKISLILLSITVFGNVVGTLLLPLYLANIINFGIPAEDIPYIIDAGGKMINFVILAAICNIATGFFSAKISMALGRDLRSKIFSKIQYFSQTEMDKFSTSSLITRTNNDIIQIQNFINMVLRVSLIAPVMCVGGIILAFAKSPSMSTVLVISVPIMIVAVIVIAFKAIPLSIRMQEKIDKINLITREKLTGIRVARAFGTEEHESNRFYKVNEEFMENSIKLNQVMGFLNPALSLVLYGTTVALLAIGGKNILDVNSGILVGDVIAVIQYVMQIMMAVMLLSMVFVMYPRASVSAKRVNEVLDTDVIIKDKENIQKPKNEKGHLVFKNVSFTFPGAEEPAIKGISFDSKPGEVTAIIGSTGSGKSTLVNLIPRFYDVGEGEILVNGINIRDYSLEDLRNRIGYVPQKSFLFKGTIDSNIKFGDSNAHNDRVIEAAKIAQSYDFIMAKDEDFNSPIAQGGSNVSGGQRQRLAISRAIVRKPEIYIFDDSFSALDFKTDLSLRKSLEGETKESTVILVAQRVSTIMNATKILVLDNGECVGQGTHKELLKDCAVYQEIVYSQLSKEEI